MKTKKTTQAHYLKYHYLVKLLGVSLSNNPDAFGEVEALRRVYNAGDIHLNKNTQLSQFDAYYPWTRRIAQRKGVKSYSLAENTCLYKHLLFYEILELEPEFTD